GGASGTEAGGIGGGRSENSWAEAGAGQNVRLKATASAAQSPVVTRPLPATPLPLEVMAPAFQRKRGKFKPA
ncbi:MAG: hypothetical protein ACRC1G_06105, partial [Bradyrhizobium sp.]